METKKNKYKFSADKNKLLITERGISFENIIAALDNGNLLDTVEHPNSIKYQNQMIYFVNINEYVYLVPFVKEDEHTIFLKTAFPSRKISKKYFPGTGV